MNFLISSLFTTVGVSVASNVLQPVLRNVCANTGLYIANQIKSYVGLSEQENRTDGDSYGNVPLKEFLTFGISTAATTGLFSNVGREIYNSYKAMNKKIITENSEGLYILMGILGLILHTIGIHEIQNYIQANRDLFSESECEDALKLLKHYERHDSNTEGNASLYNFIIDLLYKDEEYYTKGKGLQLFKRNTYAIPHVFRIIFNILIGLSTQINRVFGTEHNHGVKSFKWVALIIYFEALVTTLRIPSMSLIFSVLKKNFNTDYILKTSKSKK